MSATVETTHLLLISVANRWALTSLEEVKPLCKAVSVALCTAVYRCVRFLNFYRKVTVIEDSSLLEAALRRQMLNFRCETFSMRWK